MTLLASSVYGSAPNIKATVITDAVLQSITACIVDLPRKALVGRAACILLCNTLAGCDANIIKASIHMRNFVPFTIGCNWYFDCVHCHVWRVSVLLMFDHHQASEFGMFRELAFAASKDCDLSTLSYLLSALMNFKPTSANLATLSSARVADRLPHFVSCSDAGLNVFFFETVHLAPKTFLQA
jgi:hypothetical protein